jgi:3-oxoacyl-[acyl-carrier-protein] synthase-1
MSGDGLRIVGLGGCTPVGRDVFASAAAVRAGVCGFGEHPFVIDTAGEPMRVARAAWIDASADVADRCAALLLPAIDGALRVLSTADDVWVRCGLALALPPTRPGRPHDLAGSLLAWVSRRYPGRFGTARAFEAGHAGGHLALEAAVQDCFAGAVDVCLVCGVDSTLAPETLEWIEACGQLHGGGADNNAWGFVPGEAAGALLLASRDFARARQLDAWGEVVGIGVAQEAHLIGTGEVCVGDGLSEAFEQALGRLPPEECVHNVFCDLNGEPYRADEYGFTVLRKGDRFRAASDFVAPADCWGDIGAAGVPLHIAIAAICHRKRYGKGRWSMVWASSASGERGAALICAMDFGEE